MPQHSYRIEGVIVPRTAARLIKSLDDSAQAEAFVGSMHPDDRAEVTERYHQARKDLARYISDLSHTIGRLTNEAHGG